MVNVLTVRPKNVQAVCYANIFKRSITKNNLRYIIYIGDGDSTAFNTIEESKPYRDTIITKLECVAHVQKRLGTRCYKWGLTGKGKKLSDGRRIIGTGHLTDKAINALQYYYWIAIRNNVGDFYGVKKSA